MSNVVSKNSYFVNGVNDGVETQSILDVFVVQGQITPVDAEKIKTKFRTNREIESFLIKNNLVSKDTINKAYSILLKLPFISLENLKIPKEALQSIPKNVAKRYGVVAFGVKDNNLQIAVSKPGELNASFASGMEKIINNNFLNIEMFVTSDKDFNLAFKQYKDHNNDKLLQKTGYPTVFLRNQTIPKALLGKFPLDFIKNSRAVVFFVQKNNTYAVAAESPDDSKTLKALNKIEQQNNIKFQVFSTSKQDIDYAISLYEKQIDNNVDKKTTKNIKVDTETIKPEPQKIEKKGNNKKRNANEKSSDNEEIIDFGNIFSSFIGNEKKNESTLTIDKEFDKKQDEKNNNIDPEKDVKVDQKNSANSSKNDINKKDPEIKEKEALGKKYNIRDEDSDDDVKQNLGSLLKSEVKSVESLNKVIEENYVPKMVAAIISFALNSRASDIHFEIVKNEYRVRYRIDGILKDVAKLSLKLQPPIVSRIKILSSLKIDETRIPQDGRFDVKFKDREVDVRVSTLPTVHGEKIVLRILDKNQGILSLEDLGMKGRAFDLTVESISKPYGIILSTGPTGSGKSTTLYAIINRISIPAVNIVTLEDPVEYEIPGVNQCQVKPSIGFTFAEGLRSVLRQDPNVIMVGEIRDGETAGMATHAALTGHLVLTTLHTNNASGALPRLINMGVEPFLITSAINLVVAQRLVRRICPKCKQEMKVPQKLIEEIKLEIEKIPSSNKKDSERAKGELKFFHGVGCSQCTQGFRGRVGLFEVLRITDKVEELAIARRSANEIRKAAKEDGMITMKQDGILKALEGMTTIDEVFQATAT